MKTQKVLRQCISWRLTPRSWQHHAPVEIRYNLLKAREFGETALVTREYIPETRPINLPEVRLSDLPLGNDRPLKILVFIPTYDSQEYITERIKAVLQQGRDFPTSWSLEIAVVVNGQNQERLWQHLNDFRESEGLVDRLTLAFIPGEKNPGMIQSKTTPLNVALDYARAERFDVFCCLDDDVELSPQNLRRNIDFLRTATAEKKAPVMVGPAMRLAVPRTWLERVYLIAGAQNRSVKGCNMFFWTAALPSLPADAGNEDFLLKVLYGDRSIVLHADDVYFIYRYASSLGSFIRQNARLKWNDSSTERYLGDRFSFWKFMVDPAIQILTTDSFTSKEGFCQLFLRAMNLYSVYHVRASILARNVLNIPKGPIDWVGTVDPESKSNLTR